METIELSDRRENGGFLSYLYNDLVPDAMMMGGRGEIAFGGDRASIRLQVPDAERFSVRVLNSVSEVLCIGYKYRFLEQRLRVCLPRRERKFLAAALIAADLEGDTAFVRNRICSLTPCAVDGVYAFRLSELREKWEKIVAYIPSWFCVADLKHFCEFLAGESSHKIYLKDNAVYGEDFLPLRRSRLTGKEDVETEIVLSDAGYIYCLGEVAQSTGDFLQKYYAERAIFS